MNQPDFLIIGGGIFGICSALALCKKNYTVTVLESGKIPNPLAASTDISKIVRMEYGSDVEYMEMAIKSMNVWREWNEILGEKIYHETGFLLTTSKPLDAPEQQYEKACYYNLLKKGFQPERIDNQSLVDKFPVYRNGRFVDGFYNKIAGFAASGRAVELLANYVKKEGVQIFENQKVEKIIIENNAAKGIQTKAGQSFFAKEIIICAGNFTPYLLPELKPFMKITGHPVFHLKPEKPELFSPENFPVFAADISNTGWYGFPIHPKEKVVKIARHSEGLELHPEFDERVVTKKEAQDLQDFLKNSIPNLGEAPIVYTRRCCYTDTLDGHFWMDRHPEIENLTVGSGGSGHGFKMGPVLGEMIAQIAEGGNHKWSERYAWRNLKKGTTQMEEARFLEKKKL